MLDGTVQACLLGWAASFVLTQLVLRRRSTYLRRGKRFFFTNERTDKMRAIPSRQQRGFGCQQTLVHALSGALARGVCTNWLRSGHGTVGQSLEVKVTKAMKGEIC